MQLALVSTVLCETAWRVCRATVNLHVPQSPFLTNIINFRLAVGCASCLAVSPSLLQCLLYHFRMLHTFLGSQLNI